MSRRSSPITHVSSGATPLAASTLARKATGNSPGLETGQMQGSVQHDADRNGFTVGSNEKRALWFELGTSRGQPPRPFLSGALNHKLQEIQNRLGQFVVQSFP